MPEPEALEETEALSPAASSDRMSIEEFESGGTEATPETVTPVVPSGEVAAGTGAGQPEKDQAAAEWQSIRDAAAGYGVQFPQAVTDDRAALQYLIEQARQQSLHAELGRQLAPKANELRAYFEQQKAPKAAETHPWDEPEGFDPRFLQLVEFNQESGLFVGKPNVPASIVDKVNEYSEWKRRIDDPKVREQYVDYRAEQKATELIDKRFNEYREQMDLQEIERQNAGWLYQADGQGRPVLGQDGRYILSIPGARYLTLTQHVRQMGVVAPRAIDEISRRLLAGEVALARLNQGQAPQTPAQSSASRAATRPNRNPLQSLSTVERSQTPGATEPLGPYSLMDRLRLAMEEEGTTDEEIATSLAS